MRHLCLADLYIRQIFDTEKVRMMYVPSGMNSSDALTKVLGEQKLIPLLEGLSLSLPGEEV